MWGAAEDASWRTFHATILTQKDQELQHRALEHALRPPTPQATEPGVQVVRHSASASATVGVVRPAGTPEPDPSSFLWVRLPDAMRTDDPFGIERLVRVHRGEQQWTMFAPGDVRETEAANPVVTHPLLFPGNWADRLEIVDRNPVWHAGRQAVEVHARPADRLRVTSLPADLPELPIDARMFCAADDYVVVVDLEHGVVLRFEARFGGERMEVIDLTDVAFDPELDPELFEIQPPPGGFLPPPPREISATLQELVGQVGFTLFQPTWPDDAAQLIGRRARYRPSDPARDAPTEVTSSAPLRHEPAGVLWIRQSDRKFLGEPDTRWGEHSLGLAWTDPERPDTRSKMRLYRDGTYLHLEASLRPLDWLERVAASLVPVEAGDTWPD